MGTKQTISEGGFFFYGTTHQESCIKTGGVRPIQIVGAFPFEQDIVKFGCIRNDFNLKVFEGDYSRYLFRYPSLSDVEDFRLYKYDSVLGDFTEIDIIDSSLGEVFGVGEIPEYLDYAGFYINWTTVRSLHGNGEYKLVAYDAGSPASSLFSYTYQLKLGTDEEKDKTFKISYDNKGLFDNPFYSRLLDFPRQWDLENLYRTDTDEEAFPNGWQDEFRLRGKIIPMASEVETSYIRTSNNKQDLYYTDKHQMYELKIYDCNYDIIQRLEYYCMTGNNIRITDDNKDSVGNFFTNLELAGENAIEFETQPTSRKIKSATISLRNRFSKNYRTRS